MPSTFMIAGDEKIPVVSTFFTSVKHFLQNLEIPGLGERRKQLPLWPWPIFTENPTRRDGDLPPAEHGHDKLLDATASTRMAHPASEGPTLHPHLEPTLHPSLIPPAPTHYLHSTRRAKVRRSVLRNGLGRLLGGAVPQQHLIEAHLHVLHASVLPAPDVAGASSCEI